MVFLLFYDYFLCFISFYFPLEIFLKIYFFNGMHVCLCGHVHISMGTYRGQKRDSGHVELES